MSDKFPPFETEKAPEEVRGVLRAMHNKYGFDLNLFAQLANAPMALRGYVGLAEVFAKSSFTPYEQQVLQLAVSGYHDSGYCVAAHRTLAAKRNLSAEIIDGVVAGEPIDSPRLEALRAFAVALLETRGRPSEDDLMRFYEAGYSPPQALEVVLGIALKTFSNYANHIMDTQIDERFAGGGRRG